MPGCQAWSSWRRQGRRRCCFREAKALLDRLPEEKRGTSVLINNVATMLTRVDGSRRSHDDTRRSTREEEEEGEELQREMLATRRAELGENHPNTLVALGNLASNLYQQRRYEAAEPVLRSLVESRRVTRGNFHERTQTAVGRLGMVLLEQGKLDEAEPLCVEAAAWFRENQSHHYEAAVECIGNLVELRRLQGRLAEAEQELGSLVADARAGLGPQHIKTAPKPSPLG